MPYSLVDRQVIQCGVPEIPRGTGIALSATGQDALPMIKKGAKIKVDPVAVERRTVRLTMTPYGNIYPGVSTATVTFEVELCGLPGNLAGGANRGAGVLAYQTPIWGDLLRMCGMKELSNQGSGVPPLFNAVSSSIYAYRMDHLSAVGTANTPIRHGEALTCRNAADGAVAGQGFAVGDFYGEDDILYVLETVAPAGTATRWQGTSSGRQAVAGTTDGAANLLSSVKEAGGAAGAADKLIAFILNSDVNTTESGTMEVFKDGKKLKLRGCMGNFELRCEHGAIPVGYFEMKGITVEYVDAALSTLTNINELHNQGAKFLGRDVRIYEIGASPKLYGRDSTGGSPVVVGSMSKLSFSLGNRVEVRKNALETNGFSHALILGREPFAQLDPDEVLNSEFDWIDKYQKGLAMRLKMFMSGTGAANGIGPAQAPPTDDGNSFDVVAPGLVMDSMDDSSRDDIMAWDGRCKLTGGDYDPTAQGEAPGIDNEFVMVLR